MKKLISTSIIISSLFSSTFLLNPEVTEAKTSTFENLFYYFPSQAAYKSLTENYKNIDILAPQLYTLDGKYNLSKPASTDAIDFAKKNKISKATERVLQQCSWGLAQSMGSVARELGYMGPLQRLCDPELGILYGAKKIRQLLEKYGHNEELAISCYNQGYPYKDDTGRFVNAEYVNAVLAFKKAYEPATKV